MSNRFIPEDSSQEESARKFKGDSLLHPENQGPPIFHMEWPRLQSKEFVSHLDQYLKEIGTKVLKQAKEKSLLIEKEAYEKGFAQGEKDGMELGQKRFEAILHQFEKLLKEIDSQQKDLFLKYEKEMVQLVLSITRKIFHKENLIPENLITQTLQEAFQWVVDRKGVVVHLNPKDCDTLLAHPDRLPFPLGDKELGGVKVFPDPAVTRGGCFLETSFGDIDATLESQFDQIASLVWRQYEKSGFPDYRATE